MVGTHRVGIRQVVIGVERAMLPQGVVGGRGWCGHDRTTTTMWSSPSFPSLSRAGGLKLLLSGVGSLPGLDRLEQWWVQSVGGGT